MLDYFKALFEAFQNNPLYFTIFGSTVIGVILYVCRELPSKFFRTLLGSMTVLVEINQSTDEIAYECVEDYLHGVKLHYVCGNFQLMYNYLVRSLNLNCAPNTYFLGRVGDVWCIINKQTDSQVQFFHVFTYSLRFLTRNKEKVQKFVESLLANQRSATSEDTIKIYKRINGYWDFFEKKKIDFNCMQPSVYEDVIRRTFKLRNSDKLGILLYGIPGCGKTHLIQILASVLDRNIYYMNLSEFDTDEEFIKAMLQVHYPAIVLFEDIDCNNGFDRSKIDLRDLLKKDGAESKTPKGVSLSCLLNVFDGLLTQQNQMIVATTNHIEALDKALIRSGRFDISVELLPLRKGDIELFLANWYKHNKCIPFINDNISITVSDLVSLCKEKTLQQVTDALNIIQIAETKEQSNEEA